MHMINWYHRNPKVFYFPLLENMSFDQTVTVTVADDDKQCLMKSAHSLLSFTLFISIKSYFPSASLVLKFRDRLDAPSCQLS